MCWCGWDKQDFSPSVFTGTTVKPKRRALCETSATVRLSNPFFSRRRSILMDRGQSLFPCCCWRMFRKIADTHCVSYVHILACHIQISFTQMSIRFNLPSSFKRFGDSTTRKSHSFRRQYAFHLLVSFDRFEDSTVSVRCLFRFDSVSRTSFYKTPSCDGPLPFICLGRVDGVTFHFPR